MTKVEVLPPRSVLTVRADVRTRLPPPRSGELNQQIHPISYCISSLVQSISKAAWR